jgi:hypothetical protein
LIVRERIGLKPIYHRWVYIHIPVVANYATMGKDVIPGCSNLLTKLYILAVPIVDDRNALNHFSLCKCEPWLREFFENVHID